MSMFRCLLLYRHRNAALAQPKQFDLTGASIWTDTGIDLKPGDTVKFTATGPLQYIEAKPCGPEGLAAWLDGSDAAASDERGGAWHADRRIIDSSAARVFRSARAGTQGAGRWTAIHRPQPGGERSPPAVTRWWLSVLRPRASQLRQTQLPVFTSQLLDDIPVRVEDAAGTQGDRVNFVIVGTQNRVEAAFRAAGWV